MKKNKRIILYAGIVVIILLAIFLPRWFQSDTANDKIKKPTTQATPQQAGGNAIPITVYIAERSYISNGIRVSGGLLPSEEVEITTEAAGKVTKIFFKEGSFVHKGDMLLKINDDDLQAQLVRAEFQEKLFAEKLERQKILLTKDAISREAYDQLETDHNMIVADLQLLKVRIEKTEIRAPFDGVIGFRYVSEGSYVQPGSQVARLIDRASLIVQFTIPERYIALDLDSRNTVFRVEGFNQDFHAQVYAIEPKLDSELRTVSLRARYDNSKGLLYPGMSANVTLITSESNNSIQIPSEAIVPEIGGMSVWTVRDGRAVSVPIETGARMVQMVEVTSGLSLGDSIIISGIMQLRPNMPVRVINAE